jgi:hypothetical protein
MSKQCLEKQKAPHLECSFLPKTVNYTMRIYGLMLKIHILFYFAIYIAKISDLHFTFFITLHKHPA